MEMIEQWFAELTPVMQALLAGVFTWGITAAGAATVFLFRGVNQKLLDGLLGFSGGIMLAASYWSLLAPAIDIARERAIFAPNWVWVPAATGFLLGALAIYGLDRVLPHLHIGFAREEAEGRPTVWRRSILLVLAITLHNIPEGLAVGVAFGGIAEENPSQTLGAAIALAIGIGLQNCPEGIAVAGPLRASGTTPWKAFLYGQSSALVEPVFAVIGAAAVMFAAPILPYALSFAAGAMIFVVIEELLPEAYRSGNVDLASLAFVGGFTVMMILDVGLQ